MADIQESPVASLDEPEPPQPPRNAPSEATLLGSYDVFALIVNKMIGTGIYTAPSTVLLYTGSKQLSLGLWGVGFFYTIMSTFIYLDYAAVFPYTGGEIVYVSYTDR
jgi:amino acid transporter